MMNIRPLPPDPIVQLVKVTEVGDGVAYSEDRVPKCQHCVFCSLFIVFQRYNRYIRCIAVGCK